jgi:superfamily II DNA or RNA helicase
MNQWIERIKTFMPDVSIGIIRQNTCESDKDIIIGMIQSINSRDYPKETFSNHHVVIYDEMHHLACKGFSQAFYKCGSKITIGLSATPKRVDGLTKVLEWFLGNIITNEIMSEVQKPLVKFIQAEYSSQIEPKFNFKGTLNSQNMINQIVLDSARNNQILNEIIELNSHQRKILVLSGRREHCEFIYSKLIEKNISSGLYLGGMNSTALEKSNNADVVLATYSMASEAYDNPSLDTLIMATGMGSVQQAVGRILRKKNKLRPLVVDFTDIFYFGGQARRRKQYYKKNGYEILKETMADNSLDAHDTHNHFFDECLF